MYDDIYDLSKNILVLYKELLVLEKNNKKNNSEYKKNIENLKLYKFLEKRYYEKFKNYDISELDDFINKMNTDDVIEKCSSDFGFVLDSRDSDSLIKRRIFNNIVNIIHDKVSYDELKYYIDGYLIESDGPYVINLDFILNFDYDNLKRIYNIIKEIKNNLLIYYFKNMDVRKFRVSYLKNKYNNIFINPSIEDILIDNKNIFKKINGKEKIYYYLLQREILFELDHFEYDDYQIINNFQNDIIKQYIDCILKLLNPYVKMELLKYYYEYENNNNYIKVLN